MNISERGIQFISNWEGCKNTRYKCPAGLWTIGIGHVIQPGEVFKEPLSISEIRELFRKDIKKFENSINTLVRVPINQNQFDALVSFVFNVGIGAFANSTLLKKLNMKDYSGAADEFLRWCYANGKRLEGLARRRAAERNLFLKGV